MNERTRSLCVLLFGHVFLASCAHAGMGEGRVSEPLDGPRTSGAEEAPAKFTWRSGLDASAGEIQCTLPNGKVYAGKFAQIRPEFDAYETGPVFVGWSSPTWARDPWYGGPPAMIDGVHVGKIVALLKSKDGARMRCRFLVVKPDSGMTGGVSGQCLLSDQTSIDDVELPEKSSR